MLLVHGSAVSSRSWDALVPLLAESYRVVRVDLPGHGRSPVPAEQAGRAEYAIPVLARRIGGVLDRIGVERAVVVGHSSGGYAGVALAEERPGLVAALALINTGPHPDALIGPSAGDVDPGQWPPGDEQIRAFAASGFREGFPVPQELVEELRGATIHTVLSAMRASVAYLSERPFPERIAALGKPLQVIFGAEDRRWLSSSAADYRRVPGAEVELLPGSGHSPVMEDPPATAGLLLPFAARHAT